MNMPKLDNWLQAQSRILWTSDELVSRFGGAQNSFGRVLATRKIRQRLDDGSLSKKRSLYCGNPDAMPDFETAKPKRLRYALLKERAIELMAEAYRDKDTSPAMRDRLARAAAAMQL